LKYEINLSWQNRAACKGMPVEIFFDPHTAQQAIETCLTCAVKAQCLAWVLRCEQGQVDRYGIYGGWRPEERARGKQTPVVTTVPRTPKVIREKRKGLCLICDTMSATIPFTVCEPCRVKSRAQAQMVTSGNNPPLV